MPPIRRLVLDVLKPHEPGILEFAETVSDLDGASGVTATLVEIEENVRSLRIVIEGDDLDLEAVDAVITDLGGSIHSVDGVSCGDTIVEDVWPGP